MKKSATLLDILLILLGGGLLALAISVFLQPHGIVTGGVTGLSIMLNHLVPAVPTGTAVLVLNIPLFILGWKVSGRRYFVYSLIGTSSASVLIDVFALLPKTDLEPLLAALFGGLIMGAGMGLVFRRGASTGGTDILAGALRKKWPHMPMGQLILIIDVFVLSLSGLVFGGLRYILYAAVALFVSSKTIDALLYGLNTARVATIISEHPKELCAALTTQLRRGVTVLSGEGGYSGKPRPVLMCAVSRTQITPLKRAVKAVDPNAFVILSEAGEVLGEGFLNM